MIFGLAYQFRFQIALMIAGYFLWLIVFKIEKFKNLTGIVLGFLLVIVMGLWLDYWFYGEFASPSWNYLKFNLTQSGENFGSSPWYFYFTRGTAESFYPLGILMFVSLIYMLVRHFNKPYVWIILPFLLMHILLKHKEIRFLFCILPFLQICTAYFVYQLWKGKFIRNHLLNKSIRHFIIILFTINILLIIPLACKPAGTGFMGLTKYIHYHIGNQKLNLISFPYSNPYSPWRSPPVTQYAEPGMHQYYIDDVKQLNDSLIAPQRINYLTIRDYDYNPVTAAEILKFGFKPVKTSVPLWVAHLGNLFMGKQPRSIYLFKYYKNDER